MPISVSCEIFSKSNLIPRMIYIYANNLSPPLLNQHEELSNLVNGVKIQVTPFLNDSEFISKGAQIAVNIQAFGKHSISFVDIYARVLRNRLSANRRIWHLLIQDQNQYAKDNIIFKKLLLQCNLIDGVKTNEKQIPGAAACFENSDVYNAFNMYAKVLKNKLGASIRIWASSDTRSKSICKGQYQLRKVTSPLQLADSQVRREADSARWAVVDGKNIVCLTTNDYKVTEKQIPGAAVCLENAAVYNTFRIAASKVEACNK
ncbi:hypothetical protein T12_2932 [Trichinella patagoniensis]|uniref:Plancitoxin-1 n=1 Tax=Trichinella patagoniensis TaxID=990121 RepID=A0A0V0Z6E1_9BILA|nr:hypothetical protein T12_2932 [Trichinella patagoniensis]